jgi:hypothetical protein
MALGPDPTVSTQEFVDAMRARLDKLSPPAGNNVDQDDVKENLGALAAAVHAILTRRAEVTSAPADDAAFWTWVKNLTAWQSAVSTAAAAWQPADASAAALKAALTSLPGGSLAAPPELKGRLR